MSEPPRVDRTRAYDVIRAVLDLLGELTAAERMSVFAHFCTRCAHPRAACRCVSHPGGH